MPHRIIVSIGLLSLLLSFFGQLEAIADDSTAQTLEFALQMNNAIPCATQGIPIEECSSFNTTSSSQLKDFNKVLDDFSTEVETRLDLSYD
jgi:hypothetical protein